MWGRRSLKRKHNATSPPSPLHSGQCTGTDAELERMKLEILIDPSAVAITHIRNLGVSPVLNAINLGHTKCLKLFIESGADLNEDSYPGLLSPMFCALKDGNPEILKILLDGKIDINKPMKLTGELPLINAIILNKEESVKTLLEHGAESNSSALRWANQSSCLAIALTVGNTNIINLLFECGLNLQNGIDTPEKLVRYILTSIMLGQIDCLVLLLLRGVWHIIKDNDCITNDELISFETQNSISIIGAIGRSETDIVSQLKLLELFCELGVSYWSYDVESEENRQPMLEINGEMNGEKLLDQVKQLRSTPRSLKSLSRSVIHDHLGSAYLERIDKFEIPETLVPYLNYSDML